MLMASLLGSSCVKHLSTPGGMTDVASTERASDFATGCLLVVGVAMRQRRTLIEIGGIRMHVAVLQTCKSPLVAGFA